jgi:predicted PurR-regulated permease PerM
MEFKSPYTFDKVVRILIGVGILVVIFLLFRRLTGVLAPFFVGWLIAYLLHPAVTFFQYKLKFKSRVLSIITTLVLLGGVITGLLFILIPQITFEFNRASLLVQNYTRDFDFDYYLPVAWQNAIIDFFNGLNLREALSNPDLMALIKKVTPQLWELLNGSLSMVYGLMVVVVVLLYLIFILLDFEKISEGWKTIIPPKYRDIVIEIADDIEDGMNKYFRGQALIALIVGILFSIGFVIIDLPLAIIFGIFIGILNLVPYLKAVAIVPGMFLFMLKASEPGNTLGGVLLSVLIVFVVVQSFEDLVLVPKIMGKVTGMKPALILLSLSIWGSLMGIVGMIIALPLTTLIISYYQRWVLREGKSTENMVEISTKTAENQDV